MTAGATVWGWGRYSLVRSFLAGFLDLVAPVRCTGCDLPWVGAGAFCASCTGLVERASNRGAVFEYGGPVADAIQRLKYEGRSELGSVLGGMLADEAQRSARAIDAVVPVPLHWRRRRSRGYDQAALLAKPVAKRLRVPLLLRGLRRVRNTPSQVELPHRERQQNIAGAFTAGRLAASARVLLIDDVRTTGATLREASEALKSAGVAEVQTLVLATRLLGQGT